MNKAKRSPSYAGINVVQPLAKRMKIMHIKHYDINDINMVDALMIP